MPDLGYLKGMRPAGPFLVTIGLALLVAIAFAEPPAEPANLTIFLGGAALSFVVLFGGVFLFGSRRPTLIQRLAIMFSIGLELALFVLRPQITGPLSPENNWIAALMIVGFHFIPFAIALGSELAILGLLCMANAALAATGWAPPFVWLGIDALLKIGSGLYISMNRRDAHRGR